MTSISAGHIILTPTEPVGSGRPQQGSNPGPPDQESRALPTELPRPPYTAQVTSHVVTTLELRVHHDLRAKSATFSRGPSLSVCK